LFIRTTATQLIAIVTIAMPMAFYYQGGTYLFAEPKALLLTALGLVLLALYPLDRFIGKRGLAPADGTEMLALSLLAWLGLSALFAINGAGALHNWLQWSGAILAFWFIRRSDSAPAAFVALLAGGALVALVGYAQHRGWGPPAMTHAVTGSTPGGAPGSTFGAAHLAAQATLPLALAGIAMILATRRLAGLAAGVMLTIFALWFLVLTASLAALFSFVSASVVLCVAALARSTWGMRKRATGVLASILPALMAIGLLRPELPKRLIALLETTHAETATRLALWRDTLSMIGEAPLLGHGPGQFVFRFPDFLSTETGKRIFTSTAELPTHAAQDWLSLAAAGGLIAVILLCLLVGSILRRAWRETWHIRPPGPLPLAALSVVLGWLITMAFDAPLQNPFALLGLFTALALLAPVHTADDGGGTRRNRLAAFAALGLIGFALWQLPGMVRAVPSQILALQARQYLSVRPDKAFQLTLEAIELNPQNALAFSVMGQSRLVRRSPEDQVAFDDAEDKLRRALRLHPNELATRFSLGVALYERALARNESTQLARQEFQWVLGINPYHGRAYYMLALIEATDKAGWSRVRRNLDRAIKLEPPLHRTAAQAPEFSLYRNESTDWPAWHEGLRNRLYLSPATAPVKP
jgi:O-antigen ligase